MIWFHFCWISHHITSYTVTSYHIIHHITSYNMDDMSFALFSSPGYAETQLGIACKTGQPGAKRMRRGQWQRLYWMISRRNKAMAKQRRGWPNSPLLIQWNTSIFLIKRAIKSRFRFVGAKRDDIEKEPVVIWPVAMYGNVTINRNFEWENRDGIPSWSLQSLGQVCEPLRRCWRKAHMGCIF